MKEKTGINFGISKFIKYWNKKVPYEKKLKSLIYLDLYDEKRVDAEEEKFLKNFNDEYLELLEDLNIRTLLYLHFLYHFNLTNFRNNNKLKNLGELLYYGLEYKLCKLLMDKKFFETKKISNDLIIKYDWFNRNQFWEGWNKDDFFIKKDIVIENYFELIYDSPIEYFLIYKQPENLIKARFLDKVYLDSGYFYGKKIKKDIIEHISDEIMKEYETGFYYGYKYTENMKEKIKFTGGYIYDNGLLERIFFRKKISIDESIKHTEFTTYQSIRDYIIYLSSKDIKVPDIFLLFLLSGEGKIFVYDRSVNIYLKSKNELYQFYFSNKLNEEREHEETINNWLKENKFLEKRRMKLELIEKKRMERENEWLKDSLFKDIKI